MLTLGLVSVVLLAVGIAVDVQLRLLDSGRTQVEEAQLARTLLNRIADDLRSAVLYDPMDVEGMMAGLSGIPVSLGSLEEGGEGDGGDGGESTESSESGDDDDYQPATASQTKTVPGLFGNEYMLQVDMSRLPRLDEYEGMLSAGDGMLEDQACDVKTVNYYVISEDSSTSSYAADGSEGRTGLVRLERNRATLAWEMGNDVMLNDRLVYGVDEDAEPIAPEVAAIQFLYYDGEEWLQEWDSIEQGGLPLAVEITIAIVPVDARNNDSTSASLRTPVNFMATEESEWLIYRQLVHLPMAQATSQEESLGTSDSSSNQSAGESSSGASSSGGMSAPSGGGGGSSSPSGPGGRG